VQIATGKLSLASATRIPGAWRAILLDDLPGHTRHADLADHDGRRIGSLGGE
jgi:hypothetical protein